MRDSFAAKALLQVIHKFARKISNFTRKNLMHYKAGRFLETADCSRRNWSQNPTLRRITQQGLCPARKLPSSPPCF